MFYPYLNKIDIRYKVIWLIIAVSLSIYLTNILTLLIILSITIIYLIYSNINKNTITKKIKTISPFIVIILAFTTILRSKNPFFVYEMISLSTKGLEYGLIYSTRLLIFITSFSLITQTSKTGEFLELLKKLRIPYPIIIAFLITIRFIPTMKEKHEKIIEAQKTRGIDYENINWLNKLKIDIKSLIPVFIEGVRKSDRLAMSLLSRGFSDLEEKTKFHELKTKKIDLIFLNITLIQFITIILIEKTL